MSEGAAEGITRCLKTDRHLFRVAAPAPNGAVCPTGSSKRANRVPVYEPIVPPPSESFVWRCDDYPLPWTVWNNHPECEIHFIRNAEGTCYVGDYIGPFHAGDLYLVGRNLPHNWVTPLPPGHVIEKRDVVIQFDQDRLLGAADALPELGRTARLLHKAQRGLSFQGQALRDGVALVEAIGEAAGLDRLSLFFQLLHVLGTTRDYRVLSSEGFRPNLDVAANRICAMSCSISRPIWTRKSGSRMWLRWLE